ncbi:DUF4934 domain-containing protein [Parabacteroides sp. OttesenSCG-928-G07]|nr:DUF4934 domain-containing protein [Parabacteroides sp. OttesenSCG-928-G07]
MKNINRYILLAIAFVVLSCDGDKKGNDENSIDVATAMLNPTELKASDYFNNVRYVALETTDESVIGANPTVQLFEDKILVTTTTSKQCFLFDKTTGKFIRSIGHVGNDPEGYSGTECFIDEENERLFFNGWNNHYVSYSADGRFLERFKIPSLKNGDEDIYPNVLYHCAGDTLVGLYGAFSGEVSNSLIYFTIAGDLLGVKRYGNEEISYKDMSDIGAVHIHRETAAENVLGNYMFIVAKDMETKSVYVMPGNAPFWHLGTETFFKGFFNDTIYQVSGTSLAPALLFDLGSYAWPYEEQYRDLNNRIFISRVMEAEDKVYFRFVLNPYDQDRMQFYNGFYTKSSGETQIDLLDNRITDDLNNFIPLHINNVSSKGEFVSLVLAENIAAWFEDNPNKTASLPDNVKALMEVDAEDNPVIVLLN